MGSRPILAGTRRVRVASRWRAKWGGPGLARAGTTELGRLAGGEAALPARHACGVHRVASTPGVRVMLPGRGSVLLVALVRCRLLRLRRLVLAERGRGACIAGRLARGLLLGDEP